MLIKYLMHVKSNFPIFVETRQAKMQNKTKNNQFGVNFVNWS